jgi:hypothetical protein
MANPPCVVVGCPAGRACAAPADAGEVDTGVLIDGPGANEAGTGETARLGSGVAAVPAPCRASSRCP